MSFFPTRKSSDSIALTITQSINTYNNKNVWLNIRNFSSHEMSVFLSWEIACIQQLWESKGKKIKTWERFRALVSSWSLKSNSKIDFKKENPPAYTWGILDVMLASNSKCVTKSRRSPCVPITQFSRKIYPTSVQFPVRTEMCTLLFPVYFWCPAAQDKNKQPEGIVQLMCRHFKQTSSFKVH